MLDLLNPQAPSPAAGLAPRLQTVAVVGLGYVGLPVAVAFGSERPTIGYDLSRKRIESLRHHVDATGEVSAAALREARHLRVTADPAELRAGRFHHRRGADADQRRAPARPLAARVGERDGRPLPEAGRDRDLRVDRLSGRDRGGLRADPREALRHALAQDFHVGYSPERINPGRQGAHLHEDHEGRFRRRRGHPGEGRRSSTARW